jgi:hypothetical protein
VYRLKEAMLTTGVCAVGDIANEVDTSAAPQWLATIYDQSTNYAGNMVYGAGVAAAAVSAYCMYRNRHLSRPSYADIHTVPAETVRGLRVKGTAAIIGALTLLNVVTETKWGVETFPIARWLNGPVPDPCDAIASTVTAGIVANMYWSPRRDGR